MSDQRPRQTFHLAAHDSCKLDVVTGLEPVIQEPKTQIYQCDLDGRVKPGHDM